MDTVLFAVGAFLAGLSILSQTALWQRKEYRFDRMRSFATSPEGSIRRHPLLITWCVCIGIGWGSVITHRNDIAYLFGWIALGAFVLHRALAIRTKGVDRPAWTAKALALVCTLALLIGIVFFLTPKPEVSSLYVSTLLFFIPFLAGLAVVIVNTPFAIRKQHIIQKAKTLRNTFPHLSVIGVTGSVGKTSTKQFLHHILVQSSREVYATHEHRNSEVAVAMDMLEQFPRIQDDRAVYIAEMGAYTEGEIAALARLTHPRIGVMTMIGNQHIALFGSRERIAQAKWELITHLPDDGVAVLNADDPILSKRGKECTKRVVWFSLQRKTDVWMSDVSIGERSADVTLHIQDSSQRITIPIASKGLLASACAAAAAAHAYGVSDDIIYDRLQTLEAYDRSMNILTGLNGSTVIDDSYSASREGTLNAISHLRHFTSNDTRIVLVPVIELGYEGASVHKEIGAQIAKTGARVYVYGSAYKEDLLEGAQGSIETYTDPDDLVRAVTKDVTSDTVILLEGRVPSSLRHTLLP